LRADKSCREDDRASVAVTISFLESALPWTSGRERGNFSFPVPLDKGNEGSGNKTVAVTKTAGTVLGDSKSIKASCNILLRMFMRTIKDGRDSLQLVVTRLFNFFIMWV